MISTGLEGILWENLDKSKKTLIGPHTKKHHQGAQCVKDRPGPCPAQLAMQLYPESAKRGWVVGILSKRRGIKGPIFSHVCDTQVEVIYKENMYFMWSCFSAAPIWGLGRVCCISNTSSTVISPLLSTSHLLPLPHTKVIGIFAQIKACRQK